MGLWVAMCCLACLACMLCLANLNTLAPLAHPVAIVTIDDKLNRERLPIPPVLHFFCTALQLNFMSMDIDRSKLVL